ncbi:MAG TPA: bifunctional diguanylate cyclase/phosphodiesterase [Candidatus Angelobacter sp.]|nr:bifunctional diguanylate cyclase/phosphodiesterase [Candidatus Angelobacter sp.]
MERLGARAPTRAVSTGALTRRLLGGVIVAVIAFAITFRLLHAAAGLAELVALVAATAVTLLLASMALNAIIRPLVSTQVELEDRYAAAVADALRDPLTGLGNHRAFHEELDRQAEAATRYGVPVSLLLIDLDEFKAVNDGHGHARGDRVLRGFGQMLATTIRRADRAFRVGGDEFAVILPHTDVEGARVVARRLLAEALQPSFRVDEQQPVSFSAGLSAVPELADSRPRLYAQADAALYAAKRGGRTDIAVFDATQDSDAAVSGTAGTAIADVIARGQLAPAYQPIVELTSGRVLGVEGLIRPVPPAPFANPAELFAAAEASGRLTALDLACLETIVSGAAGLANDQFLTLNLSPSTLEAPEFSGAALLGILARHGVAPHRVVVELTERQSLHDPDRVRSRMAICRRAGVRFAADDVGAGNAGLRLLAEITFEFIKVDLGLVQRSASGGPSSAVLGSVIELASRTGATVVAEGIEDADQIPQLTAMGISVGQGYHLGRPGPLPSSSTAAHTADGEMAAVGVNAWRSSIGLPTVS